MRALIISGGYTDLQWADEYIIKYDWDYVIAADRGLETSLALGFQPDLVIGDFDSVGEDIFADYDGTNIVTYPSEKDESDTELAILAAIKEGADKIDIIGATGTRLDHVLGNIHNLKIALDNKIRCRIVDKNNVICLVDNELILQKEKQFGEYVSILSFTDEVKIKSLTGFKYCVEDFILKSGVSRGVSNQITEDTASIKIEEGIAVVIQSKD